MSKTYKNYPLLPNERINFSKISGSLELPNLVEIQTNSYKWFLEKGIDEVLREIFPIASFNEDYFIDYVSSELKEPKYTYLQCKARDYTYSAPLRAKLILRRADATNEKSMLEREVFMGDIPLMTESGTFIINGAERVIVSQIVRSPGAYLAKTQDKTGKYFYEGDLIPARGTWLEFETDQKGMINVRINRQKKMPATVFFLFLRVSMSSFTNSEGFPSGPTKSRNESPALSFCILVVEAPIVWTTIVIVPFCLS